MLTLLDLGCSHYPQPMNWPVNPDVENTDWRAVCGRPACTVRREGRRKPFLPLSEAMVPDSCFRKNYCLSKVIYKTAQ